MAPERRLPMFPVSTVLFPYDRLPLHVFEPRYRSLVADCLAADGRLGVVLISRGSEVGGGDERNDVGTEACIEVAEPQPDGRWHLVVRGQELLRVTRWLDDRPYPSAYVEEAGRSPVDDCDELRLAEVELRRCPCPAVGARRGAGHPGGALSGWLSRRDRLAGVRAGAVQRLGPATTARDSRAEGSAATAPRASARPR